MFSHAKMPTDPLVRLALLSAAAFGTYVIYSLATKGFKGASAAVTEGAVKAAGDVVTGAVIGAGRAVGIPDTEARKCYDALREGRMWDASFACPAGTFIKGVFGKVPPPPYDTTAARSSFEGVPVPENPLDAVWPLLAVGTAAYLATKGRS